MIGFCIGLFCGLPAYGYYPPPVYYAPPPPQIMYVQPIYAQPAPYYGGGYNNYPFGGISVAVGPRGGVRVGVGR